MTNEESAKFLAVIKLSYTTAYRDAGERTVDAAVEMWTKTFAEVPYLIMARAFDDYRKRAVYPPTVAEMRAALDRLYYQADDAYCTAQFMGDRKRMEKCLMVMEATQRYRNGRQSMGAMAEGRGYAAIGC